jgi:protein-tyrosine phosphatase
MGRYVDLHSHFLPALDDGARTLDMSLQMVGALDALGFERLTATPHQRAGKFMPTREAIGAAFAQVSERARERFPHLELGLGAENFWDEILHGRLFGKADPLPSYDTGKSFLFEVDPRQMPPRLAGTLFEIRMAGVLPVMAHPERYRAVQEDITRAEEIGRTAALLVDVGALDGAHGRAEMKTARRLLEEDLAHAVTSDMHSPEDQRPVAAGMAWIKKTLGAHTLERLLCENPRHILAGELP